MDARELTGRTTTHIVVVDELGVAVHRDVVEPLLALQAAARGAGFDLAAVSAFRSFDEQARIWNEKVRGERPLLARDGRLLEPERLDDDELVDAILTWSALPGASRHHWGTDLDVFDRRVVADAGAVDLVPEEYGPDGPFAGLSRWLDDHLVDHGFFRPYDRDRGGVAVEPWHVSYGPVAGPAAAELTVKIVAAALAEAGLARADRARERLPELFERYVTAVATPPQR